MFFLIITNGFDKKKPPCPKTKLTNFANKEQNYNFTVKFAQLFYLLLQCTKASTLSRIVIINMNTEAKLQDRIYTTNL
jgi:hypothetical protein